MKRWFAHPGFLVFETGYLIALPLLLLYFRPEWLRLRQVVMLGSLIYVYKVARLNMLTWANMGLGREKNFQGWKEMALLTGLVLLLSTGIEMFSPGRLTIAEVQKETVGWAPLWPLLFYGLVSVPLQEFIFRGFYISRLELVSKNPWFLILWSGVVFGLIHLFFENKAVFWGSLILGLVWSGLFVRYRNLWLTIASHILIGGVVIWFTLLHTPGV
jgi:membrane protease YdiL (CAAX protease family)